jgi:hypothetical protein
MWDEAPLSMNQKLPVPPVAPVLGVEWRACISAGVDLRRWRRAMVAGRGSVDRRRTRWRHHEERLVGGRLGPRDAREQGPRHWHGVGMDDSSPGMLSHGLGRRRHGLLGRRRVAIVLAAIAATTASMLAATVAAVPAIAAHGRRSGRARSPPSHRRWEGRYFCWPKGWWAAAGAGSREPWREVLASAWTHRG